MTFVFEELQFAYLMSYNSILCNPGISLSRDRIVAKVLCCKPEGRGFELLWGEWIFSIYLILSATLGPGIYAASNKNEYQKQKNNISGE
jgi:hypothetical protein